MALGTLDRQPEDARAEHLNLVADDADAVLNQARFGLAGRIRRQAQESRSHQIVHQLLSNDGEACA